MILGNFDNFCTSLPDISGMDTVISEARYGLTLIAPLLKQEMTILEVGSGAGLLSGFLHMQGYRIDAVEPGGFSVFDSIAAEISAITGFRAARQSVMDLQPSSGHFDLIFSIHVLEHVSNLREAFATMVSLLSVDGKMVHACPNYAFPYEPHINSFFLPWAKPHYDVNFVTASRLAALARDFGLKVEFDKGVMAQYAERLTTDEVFRKRQAKLRLAAFFAPLFQLIPAKWATPMVARFGKP